MIAAAHTTSPMWKFNNPPSRHRPYGVRKQIAGILAQIHGDAQLESAGLNGQLGDQCCR
jgi:hypothetical protein